MVSQAVHTSILLLQQVHKELWWVLAILASLVSLLQKPALAGGIQPAVEKWLVVWVSDEIADALNDLISFFGTESLFDYSYRGFFYFSSIAMAIVLILSNLSE